MADSLVRGGDETVMAALEERARASGVSIEDIAREALEAVVRPSRADIAAEACAIREAGRSHAGDSIQLIREGRDSR